VPKFSESGRTRASDDKANAYIESESGERHTQIFRTMRVSNLRTGVPMERYETPIPRVACGIAAAAMTAIIVGVSVILPATMVTESSEPRTLAASKAAKRESMDPATGLTSVDIVGARSPELSAVPCTSFNPNRKPEG